MRFARTLTFRAAALILLPGQVVLGAPLPTLADAKGRNEPTPQTRGSANRTLPAVRPPALEPSFSDPPSAQEIFRARVFPEPLVPVGGATSGREDAALAAAILAYVRAPSREDFSAFQGFLQSHPGSSWRASVLANLAVAYRQAGYFSRALEAAQEAWDLARDSREPYGRSTAEIALGQLTALRARLGHMDELEKLLESVGDRPLTGAVTEHVSAAKQALVMMREAPQRSFRCGPLAVATILESQGGGSEAARKKLEEAHSTRQGTSLAQVEELARGVDLKMRAARRGEGAQVPVPAVIHFRAGHFAAVVKEVDGRYLVKDPTFGQETWLTRAALADEGSGYFLVSEELPVSEWRRVGREEAAGVWGKGIPAGSNADDLFCSSQQSGGSAGASGGSCSGVCPMASYSFHSMLASLRIADTPVGYSTPVGPSVYFGLVYLQRDAFWPEIPRFTNFGPQWTSDWLSWIEDDPAAPAQTLRVYARGGGVERLSYDPATQTWGPFFMTDATIVRTSSSPIRYERHMPDGSVDVYAQPDSIYSLTRRVFLSEARDPQGNAVRLIYDDQFRLVALSDALGQVSTLSYDLASDPFKVTKFTDPFGRSALFQYDAAGRLTSITDIINLTSSFDYDSGSFIRSMTTPYGTTTFRQSEVGYEIEHPTENKTVFVTRRSIEATDPLGGTERVEFWPAYTNWAAPLQPIPVSVIPDEFVFAFMLPHSGISLYWDKRAMTTSPGDPMAAEMTGWLWDLAGLTLRSVPMYVKKPLENPVWYSYPGKPTLSRVTGTSVQPSIVARVLDDGSEQIWRREYNRTGSQIKETDPLGRETVYVYGTNNLPDPDPAQGTGIDLLQVKQKNPASPGGYDLLWSATYNAQHQPLTTTDAAGQTTTYTYTPRGQIATIVTPPRAGLTLAQRTTTYAYLPDSDLFGPGRLQSVTGPDPAAVTSYTYDGYGRVRTTTDSDGYVLTYDYDALDRVTKVTYPDGTFEETTYNRLDAEGQRDRLGRWTRTFHDALRRVTAVRDPLGRTTTYDWCACGSLDKVIDANGNATRWERDVQGRTTREIRADGAAWDYTYESTTSRLKQRKDPKAQVTSYEYFLDDNQKRVTYTGTLVPTPEVSYTYDPSYNRRATMTDGTGTTSYSYNPVTVPPALGAGELTSVDGPLANDTVGYTYDQMGRFATRGLSGFTSSFNYDALGRLSTEASPVGTFTFSYDGATSRPLSLSYPNGQTTQYTYFPNSGDRRLQQIKHLAPGGATISRYDYTYSPVGNISTWSQQVGGNPAKLYTLGYDAADQLTTARVTGPTPLPVPSRFAYAYDPAGNRIGEQLDDAAMGATYNNRNELISRQPGGALLFRGTLSETATVTVQGKPAQVATDNTFVGQAQVPSGTSNVVVAATDLSGNIRTNTYQVTEAGSTTSYTHDANGNLASDGTRTFEWDAENRLTAVKQGAAILASFVYDGQGRRVQKTAGGVTTSYVYDGTDVVEERLSTGSTLRYVRGPGIDEHWAMRDGSGVVTYFLADHLGSVVQATTASGAVMLSRDYDPYGNPIAAATQSGYAFTGREWDPEIQAYYYRARYMDPKIGRFLSEDPIGFDAGDVNFYAYVVNNPVNLTDPSGLLPVTYPNPEPGTPPQSCELDCVCLADCIEQYRFSNVWTLGAHSANAAGNAATGGTGGSGFGGVKPHPTSWQHKAGGAIARACKSPWIGRAGRAAGRGAVALTIFEGFYDWGLIGYCTATCTKCCP